MIEMTIPNSNGKYFFDNSMDVAQFRFETGTTLQILRSTTILRPDLAANVLGLHTYVQVDKEGNAKWGRFTAGKHNLRAADATCTWNPTKGLTFGLYEITSCKLQYESEACAGDLWNTCFEKTLGTGMDKHDFFATPEGTAYLQNAVNETMYQIGNDLFDVYYFSGHPSITVSDNNDFWLTTNVDPSDWAAYKKQQLDTNCTGILTSAEMMKVSNGYNHFNVAIDVADTNGAKYTGDAVDLFDRVIEAQSPELRAWSLRMGIDPVYATPVISCTQGIFNRYKEQVRTQNNGIPASMQLMLQGETGIGYPMRNVLSYDGYWVVARPEWSELDAMTGITSHIVMMTAPGVLGLAYDVNVNKQWEGMGLVVTQRLNAPYKGKVFFESLFRAGGLILDHRFVVYGSLFLNPVTA